MPLELHNNWWDFFVYLLFFALALYLSTLGFIKLLLCFYLLHFLIVSLVFLLPFEISPESAVINFNICFYLANGIFCRFLKLFSANTNGHNFENLYEITFSNNFSCFYRVLSVKRYWSWQILYCLYLLIFN